jgi:hypothetical protein
VLLVVFRLSEMADGSSGTKIHEKALLVGVLSVAQLAMDRRKEFVNFGF